MPAGVRAKAHGMTLRIPVGEGEATVRIGRDGIVKMSLRTHSPAEAKQRQAKALDYLSTVWRSLREGPQHLTPREVSALAGEAYRDAKARGKMTLAPRLCGRS